MPAEVQAFGWLLVILVLVVALFAGFTLARRFLKNTGADTPTEAFTLADLRDLLKQGKITQPEFDQLKQHIIAVTQAQAQPKADDSSKPIPPPV